MISPNCPIIMDATSSTSVYNSIERNARREHMHSSNTGDSTDGSNENEPLEGPNQDPEDEDTLSDDSLRLRLSDDEADASQSCTTDIPTVPYVRSDQTTSQDTATGLADFDEKVTNKECQGSKHHSQILSETHVDDKKNINSMWRGGRRREHSSNTIHSPKRSLRGHPLRVRYIHSHSGIHNNPSYFNNHNNFGRPSGYRKARNDWRGSRGKYLHGNIRNMQRKAVTNQSSNPRPELRSKSTDSELLMSNQSSVRLLDSNRRASSDAALDGRHTTSPGAVKRWLANEDPKTTLAKAVNKNNDSPPSVNDELSKECVHLNLDRESTLDDTSSDNLNPYSNNWKTHGNISNYTSDPNFTSDNWFDEPVADHHKNIQCSKTSFPKLSQSSSDFQGVESTSAVQDSEPAVPSEEKIETAVDRQALSETTNLGSNDLAKETTESVVDNKLIDPKVDSNDEIDVPSGIQTEADTNGPVRKSTEEDESTGSSPDSSVILPKDHDSKVIPSESYAPAASSEKTEILEDQSNNIDETTEVKQEDQPDENCAKQDMHNKENAEDEEKPESQETDISSPGVQEMAEQPMEIVTEDKDTSNDTNSQGKKNVLEDIETKTSSDTESIEAAECAPKNSETLKDIEEKNDSRNKLPCIENSGNSSDNSSVNLTEKNLSKPDSDIELKSLLVMKRSLPDAEAIVDKLNCKKMKITPDSGHSVCSKPIVSPVATGSPGKEKKSPVSKEPHETPKSLHYVRQFFQRDMKGKLSKLKREDLEELMIQKLVETITMRSEIGKLREQARISERNQEATRIRCQQLSKQMKDFEMVLNRNTVDRRANNDRPVPPIKINRSVGLQVNFVTDQGIQSMRALSSHNSSKASTPTPVIANGGNAKTASEKISHSTAVRRGLKVRSPRRVEIPKNSPLPVQSQASNSTPATLVISKPADPSHNSSVVLNNNKEYSLPSVNLAQPVAAAKVQNIVVNGKISHQVVNRQTVVPNNQKPESNDLIDLTEEEDKNKSTGSAPSSILPMVGAVTSSIGAKLSHPRFPRVVQATLPGNITIGTQPANIRVVQSVAQPTPTALVNNINATRVQAYVMQGTPGTGRQLVIAPNQIRPAVSTTRPQFANVTYKTGISTLANGSVRVITTAAPTIPNSQPPPAPLPDTPHYPAKNGWKLPPPPPSLKISKVTQGIVLSWNMAQSDNYADIASYQLYAYQEIPGTPPNSNLWKKVGDVRALPLPMACTLKEFTPGNNYHFAVRAVDTHSRLGQYSIPRNISL